MGEPDLEEATRQAKAMVERWRQDRENDTKFRNYQAERRAINHALNAMQRKKSRALRIERWGVSLFILGSVGSMLCFAYDTFWPLIPAVAIWTIGVLLLGRPSP